MAPADPASTNEAEKPAFVYCRSCGTKASSDWSYCRSCESSLKDAVPPEQKGELFDDLYAERPDRAGEDGCPKCGFDEAVVELLETTGVAVTPRVASQNERFKTVSCSRCGYCEFYKRGDEELLIDLFLGR